MPLKPRSRLKNANAHEELPVNQNQCMDHFHASDQQVPYRILPLELLQVHHNMRIPRRQPHTKHPRVPVQPIELVYYRLTHNTQALALL